jgi:hypothetical protein
MHQKKVISKNVTEKCKKILRFLTPFSIFFKKNIFLGQISPFDPSRYYGAVWKQSILLAVWDKTSVGSQ